MCPGVFTQANAERIENLSVTNFNYSHTVRCTFLSLWCIYVISVNGKLHWKYLFLQDRYADEKAIPPIDEQQDYKLEGFQESDGKTLLKFTRKFDTCDPRDRKLEVCVLFLRNTFIGVDIMHRLDRGQKSSARSQSTDALYICTINCNSLFSLSDGHFMSIGLFQKYHQIILFVVPPKFCIKVGFQFLLGLTHHRHKRNQRWRSTTTMTENVIELYRRRPNVL